jgi:hypothetical protein
MGRENKNKRVSDEEKELGREVTNESTHKMEEKVMNQMGEK